MLEECKFITIMEGGRVLQNYHAYNVCVELILYLYGTKQESIVNLSL